MAAEIDARIDELTQQRIDAEERLKKANASVNEWMDRAAGNRTPIGILVWVAKIGYPTEKERIAAESRATVSKLHREIVNLIKERPGIYPLDSLTGSIDPNVGLVFSYGFKFSVKGKDYELGFRANPVTLRKGEVDIPTLEVDSAKRQTIIMPENGKILIGVRRDKYRGGYSPPQDNMFAYWQPELSSEPQNVTMALRDDMEFVSNQTKARTYSDTKIVEK